MLGYCSTYFGAGGFGFIGIVALILGLILVGVVVYLIATGSRRSVARDHRAEDILKERLARGEIDVETYERILKNIGG